MLFLALAVACSLAIAVVFKAAERRDVDRTALLTVNYLAAALLAVGLQGVDPPGGDGFYTPSDFMMNGLNAVPSS